MDKIDEVLKEWYKLQKEMKNIEREYKDEHWESLIREHLQNKKDMSDDLYYFLYDELNQYFDTLHMKYNLMNLFELEYDELQKEEDDSTDVLYGMMTKVSATILIFNKMEKYEYSKELHTKLEDLYVLIKCGHMFDFNVSIQKLKKNFRNEFETCLETIRNTVYFRDYKEEI